MTDTTSNSGGGGGGSGSGASASPHLLAALQHDTLTLQRRLAEVQLENRALRYQLYQVSALLDVAVRKLASVGVSVEAPLDVRALRAEVQRRVAADAAAVAAVMHASGLDASAVAAPSASLTASFALAAPLPQSTAATTTTAATAAASDGTPLAATATATTATSSSSNDSARATTPGADAAAAAAAAEAGTRIAATMAVGGGGGDVSFASAGSSSGGGGGGSSSNNSSVTAATLPPSATRGAGTPASATTTTTTTSTTTHVAGKHSSNRAAAVATATAPSSLFQLRAHLREHTRAVQSCAFAPGDDDALLATCALDGRVIVYNALTATRTWEVQAHAECASDVAWFAATQQLLSASYDGTVKVWDCRRTERGSSSSNRNSSISSSNSPVYTYVAHGFVLAATPVDAAAVFACADSRRHTALVDVRAARSVAAAVTTASASSASWVHDSRVNTLAYDAHTSQLAMGHADGVVTVWDVRHVGAALASFATGASSGRGGGGGGGEGESHVDAASGLAVTASSPAADAMTTTTPVRCVHRMLNEPSRASIAHVALHRARDESPRLLCASVDGVVRVYGGRCRPTRADAVGSSNNKEDDSSDTNNNTAAAAAALSQTSSLSSTLRHATDADGGDDEYTLRNIVLDVPSLGFRVRSAFWRGRRERHTDTAIDDDDNEDKKDKEDAAQMTSTAAAEDKDNDDAAAAQQQRRRRRRLLERDLLITAGNEHTAAVYDVTEEGAAVLLDGLHGHRDRVTGAFVHSAAGRLVIATTSADATVRVWVPVKV